MTLKEISTAYGVDAKLLKQYFQAFANLYGICPLQKALQIYNRQNSEQKLIKEQLLGFADHYVGEWRIISPGDVYTNITTRTPMQREIVHKELVYYNDYDGYDYVRSHQADKEYYIPPKAELLKYARQEYYEDTPQTADMAKLLRETMQIADWQRLLMETILNLRFDHSNVQEFIDSLGKELPSMKSAQKVIDIYTELNNHTRRMVNRGYTPSELMQMYNPRGELPKSISFGPGLQKMIQSGEMDADQLIAEFATMKLPDGLKQSLLDETSKAKEAKPGRNDLCPCGSGKKYKKCCGRDINLH